MTENEVISAFKRLSPKEREAVITLINNLEKAKSQEQSKIIPFKKT